MADAHELRTTFTARGPCDEATITGFGTTFIWDLTDPNPTNEDCAFCDEPEQEFEVSAFDIAVPVASGQVAVKGALGMMRPGYVLG